MASRRHVVLAALSLGLCASLGSMAPGATAVSRFATRTPLSTLAVAYDGTWQTWWRAADAPVRWPAPLPAIARAVAWRHAAPGLDWGELRLSGSGEAWRVRVILVRLDPRRMRLRLDTARGMHGHRGRWTIGSAPHAARLALNTGQFTGALPWGWVVLDGHRFLPPQHGPLSTAVVIDTSGRVRLVPPDSIAALRASRSAMDAFQSYPTLLVDDGIVPVALRLAPRTVHDAQYVAHIDLEHRDARLALGVLRDGRVLVALTRFDALDGALDFVPFGLTTPEMAALMGALGCARAVMLDGGISSQLLIRDADGATHRWPGIRSVPLGLIALPHHHR